MVDGNGSCIFMFESSVIKSKRNWEIINLSVAFHIPQKILTLPLKISLFLQDDNDFFCNFRGFLFKKIT